MTSTTVSRGPRLIAAAIAAVALVATMTPAPGRADAARRVSVIVQSLFGADHAATAVESVDGTVARRLPIVRGVSADIPRAALDALRGHPGIYQVTPDAKVTFDQAAPGDFSLEPQRVQKIVGSDRLWTEGVTGDGVTVALVDTGVNAAHPDLAGRVIRCVDLTFEAGTEAECADTFGHGTFMAGLIAGDGSSSGGRYKGTAPDARLVSVKVAGFDGSTDISHVLAGIQWVVAHRSAYSIKVLNLSLGSNSSQSSMLSPLNFAVQRAWKAGVTVVVSAGNSGPDPRTVLKPADDPYVITVGATDDEATLPVADDKIAVFSSRGPTRSNGIPKPDVVAPGVHTISLRSPGSAIDQMYGSTAVVDEMYFRGTGTSMAAATVTGVVAQIVQANPSLVPDQIKSRLTSTARQIVDTDRNTVGAGIVDAYAATRSRSTARANQGLLYGPSTGLGSLQGDRGSLAPVAVTPNGETTMQGEYKAQYSDLTVSVSNPLGLLPWSGALYTTTGWDPTSYALTSWVKNEWASMRWRDSVYAATEWDSMRWRGSTWSNADWDSMRWRGVDWDSMRWRATTWQTIWYAAAWD